ncbi:hypothetical protein B0T14DRAFT_582062 [Immersiella caudata]|uniref:Uncharacterized protein n=1 Tax=Immersiella caudata TaxID=314043 RepID=A0AA39WXM0_9PEZI|nr:hypothetical protein B0T14DRAFT_582062 [Immersiella caudata]
MAGNTDREPASDPSQDDDLDSLFGGGDDDDDDDSLFGAGDDDCPSLFTEDAAPSGPSIKLRGSESEAALLKPHSNQPEAANPSFQLTLATPSSAKPNNTELTLPLTLPQRPAPNEYSELTLPTVPDPANADLLRLEGHTSGDPVVSNFTHTSDIIAPLAAAPNLTTDNAALEAMLLDMWNSLENGEEMVNTPSEISILDSSQYSGETSLGLDDGSDITLDQIPGFRYANLSTTRDLRLPRRIDHSLEEAEVLVPYLTLSRNAKMPEFYQALQLDAVTGKRLRDEMRDYITASPFAILLEKRGSDQMTTKKALTDAAFYMLVNETWGMKWFGPSCETARARTLFWPANSTLILVNFVRLLNRVLINAGSHSRIANRYLETNGGPYSTLEVTPSRSPSVAPPPVYGTTGSSVTRLPVQQSNPLLDSLVTSAMNAKRKRSCSAVNPAYEVEIPDDAKLNYRVCVRDVADGGELGSPATYQHGNMDTTLGVYSYLKKMLEAGGHRPIFEILTPAGVIRIDSEAEWDRAVVSIYNRRRSGGQVEVDIWV